MALEDVNISFFLSFSLSLMSLDILNRISLFSSSPTSSSYLNLIQANLAIFSRNYGVRQQARIYARPLRTRYAIDQIRGPRARKSKIARQPTTSKC